MRRFPLAVVAALTLAALAPTGAGAADKDERAEKSAAADKCRGIDMLAETAAKDPQTYTRIMAEAAATKNAGAILWKVEKDGRPASYLFGTVHLTDDRVTDLSPAVKAGARTTRRSSRWKFPTCRRTPRRR